MGGELIPVIEERIAREVNEDAPVYDVTVAAAIRIALDYNRSRIAAMRCVQERCPAIPVRNWQRSYFTHNARVVSSTSLGDFKDDIMMSDADKDFVSHICEVFDDFGNPQVWEMRRAGSGLEYVLVIHFDSHRYLLARWGDDRMPSLSDLKKRFDTNRIYRDKMTDMFTTLLARLPSSFVDKVYYKTEQARQQKMLR